MKRVLPILLLLLFVNRVQAQKLEGFSPDGLAKNPNYAQIIKAGKLLFLAGQKGTTADGKLAGPGMKEQVDQAFNNIVIALKSQGADLGKVAMITTYVTNMDEYRSPEVLALRLKRLGNNRPVGTLVQVVRLANPDAKVEMQAIAVLP